MLKRHFFKFLSYIYYRLASKQNKVIMNCQAFICYCNSYKIYQNQFILSKLLFD